jgi:4-hydroxybenzoate polyprenyltransferase
MAGAGNPPQRPGGYWKSIKKAFIYGGYLTSLGCPAFVFSEAVLLNIHVELELLLIAYLLPLIVYCYNYYSELDTDNVTNPDRVSYLKKWEKWSPLIIGVYGGLLAVLLIRHADNGLTIFVFALIASGILYTLTFKNLTKKIPGFKNIYTSLVWASAGAFLLPFYYFMDITPFYVPIFSLIFLKGLINSAFFDLKDKKSDRERGLKTLPVLLGKKRTINYLKTMNMIAIFPLAIGVYTGIIPLFALAMIAFYLYDSYYIGKAERVADQDLQVISYMFADTEFILWPILLIIAKMLFT